MPEPAITFPWSSVVAGLDAVYLKVITPVEVTNKESEDRKDNKILHGKIRTEFIRKR